MILSIYLIFPFSLSISALPPSIQTQFHIDDTIPSNSPIITISSLFFPHKKFESLSSFPYFWLVITVHFPQSCFPHGFSRNSPFQTSIPLVFCPPFFSDSLGFHTIQVSIILPCSLLFFLSFSSLFDCSNNNDFHFRMPLVSPASLLVLRVITSSDSN